MKILISGHTGQVARELQLALREHELISLGRQDFDLSRPQSLRETIMRERPALVINAAAYTAVDQAEQEREDRVELALGEELNTPARKPIERAGRIADVERLGIDRVVEQGHVHQQNAEDRKTTQDIDRLYTLARLGRRHRVRAVRPRRSHYPRP